MRHSVAGAILAGLVAVAHSAGAQSSFEHPWSSDPAISDTTRAALLNSVLRVRQQMFGQAVVIDACELARVVGAPLASVTPMLREEYRTRVVGRAGACARSPGSESPDPHQVLLLLRSVRYENGEFVSFNNIYIGGPRPIALVLRLTVVDKFSGSRIEEWVMAEVRPGVYDVRTVRISGMAHS